MGISQGNKARSYSPCCRFKLAARWSLSLHSSVLLSIYNTAAELFKSSMQCLPTSLQGSDA